MDVFPDFGWRSGPCNTLRRRGNIGLSNHAFTTRSIGHRMGRPERLGTHIKHLRRFSLHMRRVTLKPTQRAPGSDVPRPEETTRLQPSPVVLGFLASPIPGTQNRSRLPVIQAKLKCPFTGAAPLRRLCWCKRTVIPQESHSRPHEHSSAFVDEKSTLVT